MKVIKVHTHYNSALIRWFFPSWVSGFTVGSHIFFRKGKKEVPARLMNHELIHVCQYADRGITNFLWEYLWEQRDVAYREKEVEKEAYAHERDFGYIARRWPHYRLEIE